MAATAGPASHAFPAAAAAPPPEPALLDHAIRRALAAGRGRVVLRVEEPAPHRRRVARALLQEGALAAGGQVLDGPRDDLLLVGAEAGRAARLRSLLERLVGPAATLIWSLDHDAEALRAYAAGGAPAAPRPPATGPDLAALDGFLAGLPLPPFIRRSAGIAAGEEPEAAPRFLRLEPDRARLAAALGPLGADADLLDHAAQELSTRLLATLARPEEARALFGRARPARLHLPLPAGFRTPQGPPTPPGALVATLPLAAAADPASLAARQAALAAAGIALELDGLDAAALRLLDPAALPPVLLRLHWSPDLAAPEARDALAALDPARCVLAGAATPEARRFAAGRGIAQLEGALP
jgi:hypothetical protein